MKKVPVLFVLLLSLVTLTSCEEGSNEYWCLENDTPDEFTFYLYKDNLTSMSVIFYQSAVGSSFDSRVPWNADSVMFFYRDTFYVEHSRIGNSVMNRDNYITSLDEYVFERPDVIHTYTVTESYIKSLPISTVEPVMDGFPN